TRVSVGQRVVLGKDRDRGAFRAELGAKGSLEVTDSHLDLETEFARRIDEGFRSEHFLELEFGPLVDLMADRDGLVLVLVNRAANFRMGVHRLLCDPPLAEIASRQAGFQML